MLRAAKLKHSSICGGPHISRFCDLLRGFERRLTPVMRQHHVAGDKAFVDYSGRWMALLARSWVMALMIAPRSVRQSRNDIRMPL